MVNTIDDCLSISMSTQVAAILGKQRSLHSTQNAEMLCVLINGLTELANALDNLKSVGLSTLTQEQIDMAFARMKLMGEESKNAA